MAESSFLARNKAAITLAVLASAGAVGAYWFYSQQKEQAPTDKDDSKKKRSKKKKKSTEQAEAAAASDESVPYPVNSKKEPDFTDEQVAQLTEEQKEEWAVALKTSGNALYKLQNFPEAIKFYTAALRVKEDPVFYLNRSACYSSLDDHENVIADASEAIRLKPDYAKCILRRASSYEELERYTDAMFDLTALTVYGAFNLKSVEQRLERVLQKHSIKLVEAQMRDRVPQLPSAVTLASFFGAFVHETNPEGVSAESTGADRLLWEVADAIYSKKAEKYDDIDTLIQKAVTAYEDEKVTASSPNATKATIAYEYAVLIAFLKYDRESLASSLTRAFELKPRARTYVVRALVNAETSTMDLLLSDFQKAEEIEPENPDGPYHKGQLYYLHGELDKAEACFIKAKELSDQNLFAYIQHACVVYRKGKFEEAVALFDEAKLKFPTSPEVLNYYGDILADRGDTKGAIKQYDIAIRLQRDLPGVGVGATPLINKATLLQRDGLDENGETADLLTKAAEMDPKNEAALISLAQLKLTQDKADEAVGLFEEAARLSRSFDDKVLATSFAEATKMQLRIRADPELTRRVNEILQSHAAGVLR